MQTRDHVCENWMYITNLMLIKTLYYGLYCMDIDRHSSYWREDPASNLKKGGLEWIVKTPFLNVILWSSVLHWA